MPTPSHPIRRVVAGALLHAGIRTAGIAAALLGATVATASPVVVLPHVEGVQGPSCMAQLAQTDPARFRRLAATPGFGEIASQLATQIGTPESCAQQLDELLSR